MYRVGFDISALDPNFREHAWRGIGRYVRNLKDSFTKVKSTNISIHDFEHKTFIPRSFIDALPFGRVTVEQQIFFPLQLWWQASKQFDVLHFPAHMDAPAWCKMPYIITVLDLIPLILEDLYKADRPNWRFKLARYLEIQAIKNASLVLTISENTAKDVHSILKIPKERIRVTPLGVDQKFFDIPTNVDQTGLRQTLKIPNNRPILLYVGGIDQRKNYPMLIQSLKEVVQHYGQHGKPAPVLVMVGGIEKDLQYPKLLSLINQMGLTDDVVLTGYLRDEELLKLYGISTIFLFLSLYEGFGLPVLEAMASGLPVIAGNNSAIPEVVGQAGVLVNVQSLVEVTSAITKLIDDEQMRANLARLAKKQAAQFTWLRTAELTVAAYQEFATKNQHSIRK